MGLTEVEADRRKLIVEHDEVCDRAESLGAQLAVMTSDKERLDAEVKFQTETVQELRDLVTRLTVDGEQFQATIASLNDSVARLELQKRDAEEKTEMETRRHEAYKEMRNSEQKKLKEMLEASSAMNAELNEQISRSTAEIERLGGEVQRQRAAEDVEKKLTALEKREAGLYVTIKQLETVRNTNVQEIDNLREIITVLETGKLQWRSEKASLLSSIESLKQQVTKLTTEREKFSENARDAVECGKKLRAILEEEHERLATLKAENEASAAQCRQLVDDRARLDVEHRAQIESMTTAHEYMVRLLEEAKDKAVQEGGQTMLKLREAVDKLTTQSSSLEEKIELVAKTEKKNALLLKTLEAKEETVITLRNESAQLRRDLYEAPRRCKACDRRSKTTTMMDLAMQWSPF